MLRKFHPKRYKNMIILYSAKYKFDLITINIIRIKATAVHVLVGV